MQAASTGKRGVGVSEAQQRGYWTHVLRSSSISIVFCCPVAGLASTNFMLWALVARERVSSAGLWSVASVCLGRGSESAGVYV